MQFSIASAIVAFAATAAAHMDMSYPPPLKSKHNPYSGQDIDYSITSPISAAEYPCKGTLSLLGTEAATPVVTWAAGGSYNMTIEGGANHLGGSCQASLSYDQGNIFKVIHSYIGNCPVSGTSSYDFNIPSDAASGDALFAWTWFNNEGNREMYMNCAVVTIGGSSSKARDASLTSFDSRPDVFVANIDNGCTTVEGKDVSFPNPGPDVTDSGSNTAVPVGSCGSSSSGGSYGASSASSVAASTAYGSASTAYGPVPAASTTYGSAPASSSVVAPGGDYASRVTSVASSAAYAAPTGGVFIPTSEASTSIPTTLVTATRSVAISVAPIYGGGGAATATGTASAPASTGSSSASSGLQKVGSACTNEGAWNCVDGSSFQRCASGQWSAAIVMSWGTSCQSGVAAQLVQVRSFHAQGTTVVHTSL